MEENESALVPRPETATLIGAHLDAQVAPLRTRADMLVISDASSHLSAVEWLRDTLVPRRKAIEEFFWPLKAAAHEFHRKLCQRETVVLAAIPDAMVRGKIIAWEEEQEAIRRAAEAEALARAEAEAEAARIAAAEQAMDAGDLEQAETILQHAPLVLSPPVHAPMPFIDGVNRRETWTAEVTNKLAFLRWVMAAPEDRMQYVEINQPAVRALARRLKGAMQVPGLRPQRHVGLQLR